MACCGKGQNVTGKPQLGKLSLWIAQNDFKINESTQDLSERALVVANDILNSQKLAQNPIQADACQQWLHTKVEVIKATDAEYLEIFCAADNKCSKVQSKETVTCEEYAKSYGFAQQEGIGL